MNCPTCERYVLAKHCRNDADSCPWFYCQTCKIDFDPLGRQMAHQVMKEG